MNKTKIIAGSLLVVILVIVNCWQYGLFDRSEEDHQNVGKEPSRPYNNIGNVDSSIIADIKTHTSYPVGPNLFSLREPVPRAEPIGKPVEAPKKIKPIPVASSEPKPEDIFKVLAVSRHSRGVSALISYQGITTTVKVGDVFAERYKVTAIEDDRVMLKAWNVK